MYCIKCGVKLSDTEHKCPLCGTVPYHPDISRVELEPLYPENRRPTAKVSPTVALIIVSCFLFLPMIITMLCDISISGAMTWSGYVICGIILAYIVVVLPLWFEKPNPVIFVPLDFVATGGFLLYINYVTNGDWFLSFAFPVVGAAGIIVTAAVTLIKYVRGGVLYTLGGAIILLGAFMPVMEFLLNFTFGITRGLVWSWYPLFSLAFVGGLLIFFAISRPAREVLERKMFI
ncbi:MAG: zinc ribbon domain-containing protein [Clostridia bacterium]|nr:zinc ribbon domain-containing protein [Clostridia bacterium]